MSLNVISIRPNSSGQTIELELWKVEISAANNAFIHGQHTQAFKHYKAALDLARMGVANLLSTENASHLVFEAERQIAAFVVTHHNLADLYRQENQLVQVIAHLCDAHETLFQLSHHLHLDIRSLAQRHLKFTYQELMSFTQQHGQYLRIQQTIMLTQYICDCCRQKLKN